MMTLLTLLPCLALPGADPAAVDYTRDIKPLLAKHCVACHGAERPRGGLRLDTAEAALAGGKGGPAVEPGHADDSPLILYVKGDDGYERMPLKRPPLADAQVDALRRWIDAGAPAPADEEPSAAPATHWAFVAPSRPEPPTVKDESWSRGAIDRFVLAKLEADGLAPSPEADRATLIRRASLDLIGLPPTPAQVNAFLNDDRPDAYERLVDRLLASPHYGERWARLWLDMARYADSNGYSIDAPRQIWKYRDWVIDALNDDLPFDRFGTEQLAGDLIPGATTDQLVATGFHRNTQLNQEGGIDPEQFRVESTIDRVNTTATVFLGLTLGCTQCHDHKYDPFTQREYYQFFAFFNSVDEPELPVGTPEEVARREQAEAEIQAYLDELRTDQPELLPQMRDWELSLDMVGRQKQSQDVRAAFDTPFAMRTEAELRVVFAAFVDQAESMKEHRARVAALRKQVPKIPTSMIVRERKEPRKTHVLIGGDFTRPGDPVAPGTPASLPALESDGTPDRLDLAHWLFDARNPLTARVTANRLWQALFGRGLVETENDFGTQGAPPTYPELLDWLATELVARGWSQKALLKEIATSATYRQASRLRPDLAAIDRDNYRLARQSRLRIDAELIRDSALAVAGLLADEVGGPSVFPPQPDGVMSLGQMRREWKVSDGPERYRRGLYTYFWRATPHPALMVFDAPDSTRACTRRVRSNTPLQALTLLNDAAFFECAQSLAGRLIREATDDDTRLSHAFRLCLARTPTDRERARLHALLDRRRADGAPEAEAWTTVARVLLNLDEFITRE